MFAFAVTFRIVPGGVQSFIDAVVPNARASVRDEPGCTRFDVWTDPDRPDEVFLYEIYDDAAAFEAHKQTPHFAAFDAVAKPLIAEVDLRLYGQAH